MTELPMELDIAYHMALPIELTQAAFTPQKVPAVMCLNATVVDHHDGDTFYAKVPVAPWWKLVIERQPVRILGIAARELKVAGGTQAAEALRVRPGMTIGSPIVLSLVQTDRYPERLDAVVSYLVAGTPHDLATDLIAEQWAVPWNGSGAQPKPPWPRKV